MIYLDYNATTPLCDTAWRAMQPYFERHFGNPSSVHRSGRETRAAIDDARDRLAALLGAKPHEIIFTSGGTESDNLGVIGLARSHASRGKHVITSATEPIMRAAAINVRMVTVSPAKRVPNRTATIGFTYA